MDNGGRCGCACGCRSRLSGSRSVKAGRCRSCAAGTCPTADPALEQRARRENARRYVGAGGRTEDALRRAAPRALPAPPPSAPRAPVASSSPPARLRRIATRVVEGAAFGDACEAEGVDPDPLRGKLAKGRKRGGKIPAGHRLFAAAYDEVIHAHREAEGVKQPCSRCGARERCSGRKMCALCIGRVTPLPHRTTTAAEDAALARAWRRLVDHVQGARLVGGEAVPLEALGRLLDTLAEEARAA